MADSKATTRAASSASPPQQQSTSTWLDPGTWSASFKFLPAYVALIATFIAIYWNHFFSEPTTDVTTYESCAGTFNYSYIINAAIEQAHDHAVRPAEVAYAFEATLQVLNPERSVFGADPFPDGKLPSLGMRLDEASLFAEPKLKPKASLLFKEEKNSVSEPVEGVAALMLSQKWNNADLMTAATRQKDILLNESPRYSNGAISPTSGEPQPSSDAVAMFPPFLAYYGVATADLELIRESVRQIGLYRDVLRIGSGRTKGLWRHVVGSSDDADEGAWSTGNARAAYGMARVRATITAWPTSNATLTKEKNDLDTWIAEIFSGAVVTDDDSSGLLRNYMGDSTWSGETSGTSLLAAAAYRMAIMRPEVFAKETYLDWMHRKRRAVVQRVDEEGVVRPAVNPSKPKSKTPFTGVSPEGESFLLLLSTAWRDCVCAGICLDAYAKETGAKITREAISQDKPAEKPNVSAQDRAMFYTKGVQSQIEDFLKPYMKPLQPFLNYLAPP